MQPIDFPQSNKRLLKPEGMTDEECGPLPIVTDGQVCVSLWKVGWQERISVLLFGRVWLFVWSGQTQPPVSLEGKRDIFKLEKPS